MLLTQRCCRRCLFTSGILIVTLTYWLFLALPHDIEYESPTLHMTKECRESHFTNELQNYLHYTEHKNDVIKENKTRRLWHSFRKNGGTGECFTITAKETWLSKPTQGGSSFRVFAESKVFVDLCNVEDLFNGTYIITCPHSNVCTAVHVYLMYSFSKAFLDQHEQPENTEVWKTVHCRKGRDRSLLDQLLKSSLFSGLPHTPKCRVKPRGEVSWIKDEANYDERLAVNNCVINISKYDRLFPCIDQLNIYFIGDNHMRNNFFYVLYKLRALRNTMANNVSELNVGNMHFRYANRTKELAEKLEIISTEAAKQSSYSIIVFNTGMLDIIHDGLQKYFTNFDRYLNTTVARIKKSLPSRVHLVWFSTYAYPLYMGTQKANYHINNYKIAAANTYIELELGAQGVEIFDVSFHASNIRQDRTVCGYYYVCKLEKLSYVHGYIGSQIMDAFMLYMCQPPESAEL